MEPECRIRLEVFEGPLDLLLHLINRNRLSITDISISLVTNQYLEYLEFLKALDIEVAAEYLVMAATLMQIKSKMLLPAEPSADEEVPAMEILDSLEELKKIKQLADILDRRPVLERDVFLPSADLLYTTVHAQQEPEEGAEETFDVSILDLMDAFKKVLGSAAMPRTLEIIRARVDMEARMEEIEQMVRKLKKMEFSELFPEGAMRQVLIASFLAILELARRGIIRLIQETEGGKIIVLARLDG